jgi:uncharacterized damage-inducible protein DinB
MAEDNFTLTTFYSSWKAYQDHIVAAVAALTEGQLALRAAPGLRSVGEIALHIVGCRAYWFVGFMGEDGGEEMAPYMRWNERALTVPTPGRLPSAAELAQGLARTWRFMADCFARWSPDDLRRTYHDVDEEGRPIEVSRAWVVWHVLEHDLHHGGELSLTLGTHGIDAAFAL